MKAIIPALLVAAAGALAAEPTPMEMPLPQKVPVPGSEYHRLQFADGTLSPNDRCPVAKKKLNPKMPPVRVNGQPVGFC